MSVCIVQNSQSWFVFVGCWFSNLVCTCIARAPDLMQATTVDTTAHISHERAAALRGRSASAPR